MNRRIRSVWAGGKEGVGMNVRGGVDEGEGGGGVLRATGRSQSVSFGCTITGLDLRRPTPALVLVCR
jgi:hypothetical protein